MNKQPENALEVGIAVGSMTYCAHSILRDMHPLWLKHASIAQFAHTESAVCHAVISHFAISSQPANRLLEAV
jgi:hypothetical protein